MPARKPQNIEEAEKKLAQAQARLELLRARQTIKDRKLQARRKIILGALVLDAHKSKNWPASFDELFARISRDVDRKAFEGWSLEDE